MLPAPVDRHVARIFAAIGVVVRLGEDIALRRGWRDDAVSGIRVGSVRIIAGIIRVIIRNAADEEGGAEAVMATVTPVITMSPMITATIAAAVA